MVILGIGKATRHGFALVFGLGLAAGCGGAQAPAEAPVAAPPAGGAPPAPPASSAPAASSSSSSAASGAAPTSGPPIAWDSMSHDQKKDYMKKTFFPKMKEDFVAFDGKKYADMNCVTCHGDGAKDGSFKMPNPKLPQLSVALGFKKHMMKTPDITKFMMSKVVPDSAALVGEAPYDPKTQKGFGCVECHTLEH